MPINAARTSGEAEGIEHDRATEPTHENSWRLRETDRKPLISVVATAFNEQENLRDLYDRVRTVLEATGDPFELMIVDNGSTDSSLALLRKLHEEDPRVSYVSLSRNFGHQGGLIAALDFSRGDIVISMDADLQHPPETIPALVERWREGYDVVHAVERASSPARPVR